MGHGCDEIHGVFSALYLPNTWGGETALEEYSETLKEVDKQHAGGQAVVRDYGDGGGNRCTGGGYAESGADMLERQRD